MRGHDRAGLHQRVVEDYEQEEDDEYEEEDSEPEDDNEQEVAKPTKEEQEFLKLREQLKDKIRQKLKKQNASALSHLNQSQNKKRTVTNDQFGSFFGPYQPVIASRVIEESRSIRETQHIMAKVPSSSSSQNKRAPVSSSTESKTHALDRQEKDVKEIKNKARALKDMRDYSFLMSDDADFPVPVEDRPAPKKASAPNSDGRSVQAPLKSKIPASNPTRLVSNGHQSKNSASSTQHRQLKVGPVKEAPMNRPKPASAVSRKAVGVGAENGPGRHVGPKSLPPKVNAQAKANNKPPAKVMDHPSLNKKLSTAKVQSSIQNHYPDQRKVTHGPEKVKTVLKQPLPSSKPLKPSKPIAARGIHEDRPKKRPAKRDYGDEDDNAIQLIRSMFSYNPSKYAGIDDEDDSDMEVGFDTIMKEEQLSAKIAREEDEEELRLEEEEKRRERMRKKQKMLRQR